MQSCPGAKFNMDEKGIVEVSGICDPYEVWRKIGQSSRIEPVRFQYGQCSSNLFFVPENNTKKEKKKEKESLAVAPQINDHKQDEGTIAHAPSLQQPIIPYNNYNSIPLPSPFNYYNNNRYYDYIYNHLPFMYNLNPNGLGGGDGYSYQQFTNPYFVRTTHYSTH
ncbi:Unknown protein [Striga hermonthica]|uniref:Uncharacterized protein n=1 Tax=Striga hermonthica TaxID=68872 RepID=A0A9N7R4S2_STRHE|nr:Unknown protein [Striga hermonthica]